VRRAAERGYVTDALGVEPQQVVPG
jgi:hypothetical protein